MPYCSLTLLQVHLDQFDHPPKDEEELEEEEAQKEKIAAPSKRARTASVTSPGASASPPAAAAASSSPSPSPPAPRAKVECKFGSDCYNKDADHLKRFLHPKKQEPTTKEEFILTTNQSQHDLADYYQFGGDLEEDELEEVLVADRNERKLSIQRFSDKAIAENAMDLEDGGEEEEDAGDVEKLEIRTTVMALSKKTSFFEGCASDDEDQEDAAKTVLAADYKAPPRVKSGSAAAKKIARANSTDETVKITRQSSRARPAAVAPAPAAAAAASSSNATSSGRSTSNKPCPFLLPELLSHSKLTVENEEGDLVCKKCKQEVGDHPTSR